MKKLLHAKLKAFWGVNAGAAVISIIFIIALTMAACQPTPEKPVVVNKNDGKLEEIIAKSPEPSSVPYEAPEAWNTEFEVFGGKMKVYVDAPVETPGVNAPVAKISPHYFTQEEADKLIKFFLKDAEPISGDRPRTKEELTEELFQLREKIQSGDYEGTDEQAEWETDNYEEQIRSAPASVEDEPAPPFVDGKGFAVAGKNSDAKVIVSMSKDEHHASAQCWFDHKVEVYTKANMKALNVTEEEAIKQSDKFIADLGADYMKLAFVTTGERYDRACRLLYYTRELNGFDTTYEQCDQPSGADEYTTPWGYERIVVFVDDWGVAGCMWNSPVDMDEIMSENTALIPFEDIQARFKEQIAVEYGYAENSKTVTLDVNIQKIKLGLMGVKRKDSDDYLLVPVWDFFGSFTKKNRDENEPFVYGDNGEYSLVTINALDGTVVKRENGF